jgi:RHS repeat-associated protein
MHTYDSLGIIASITHPTSGAAVQSHPIAQGGGYDTVSYRGATIVSSTTYGPLRGLKDFTVASYTHDGKSFPGANITRSLDGLGRVTRETSEFTDIAYTQYSDWGFVRKGTRTTAQAGAVAFEYYPGPFGELDKADFGSGTIDYAYDGRGNLTGSSGLAANGLHVAPLNTITYDAKNRNTAFKYDTIGRLTRDGRMSYQYNAVDQVSQIATLAGAEKTVYLYDGDSQRTYANDGDAIYYLRDLSGRIVSTIRYGYTYAGDWLLKEEKDIVYLNNDVLMTETQVGGVASRQYVLGDHFGSPAAIIDESNNFQPEEQWYAPYGEEMLETARSRPTLAFAGYERDSSGMDYARLRYYVTGTGRFNRPDPHYAFDYHNPYGLNLYSYANANPIALRDPLGLATVAEILDYEALTSAEANQYWLVTYGWVFLGTAWYYVGFEGISTVVDRVSGSGRELEAADVVVAAIEVGTLGKGGGVLGKGATAIAGTAGRRLAKTAVGVAVVEGSHELSVAVKQLFKARAFRKGLEKLTGSIPFKDAQAHHVFPQEFEKEFLNLKIDVNDPQFAAWVKGGEHQSWSKAYAREWARFLSEGKHSLQEVYRFARELAQQYEFDVHF